MFAPFSSMMYEVLPMDLGDSWKLLDVYLFGSDRQFNF